MSSNFPLSYGLFWLPRLLRPSLDGDRTGFAPPTGGIPPAGQTARLVFLGDLSAVANRQPPLIETPLREKIASADLVIANCESPIVERPLKPLGTLVGTRHAMTRQFLTDTLEAAGIDPRKLVMSLANNHALDQGPNGFAQTRQELSGLGIQTIGGAADGPVKLLRTGPMTIAFAAFTQWRNASAQDFDGRVTTRDDFEQAGWTELEQVEADFACAVPHWDFEFHHFPNAVTRAMARRLAGAGVDLIVGGHAHVVQPAERIGNTLVAYSLGDFLGTAWPRSRWPLRLGAILAVDVALPDPVRGQHRGKVAAYELAPFARVKEGKRERLTPLQTTRGRFGREIQERWNAVLDHR